MLSLAQSCRQTGCLGARGGVIAARRLPLSARRVGAPSEGMHRLASFSRQDCHRKKKTHISSRCWALSLCAISSRGKERRPHRRALCGPASMLLIVVEGELFLHRMNSSRDSVTL